MPLNHNLFRRTVIGAGLGATLEWYDFTLFSLLVGVVWAPQYFPWTGHVASVLAALAVQGAGFLLRPVGGVFFGRLSDRSGRGRAFVWTFSLTAILSIAVGILPTAHSAGPAASIALVFLRLLQGFAMGGEFGSAVVLVAESAPAKHCGKYAAIPMASGPAGAALAALIIWAVSTIVGGPGFVHYGWRLAYLLAIPWILWGVCLRKRLHDALPHVPDASRGPRPGVPPRALARGLVVRCAENLSFYAFTSLLVAYAALRLHLRVEMVLLLTAASSVIQTIGMLAGGALGDVLGRRMAMLGSGTLLVAWCAPYAVLLGQGDALSLMSATGVGALLSGVFAGAEAVWLVSLFPRIVRSEGASLTFQLSSLVAGAPAPLLLGAASVRLGAPAISWIIGCAMLAGLGVLLTAPDDPASLA